MIISNGNEKQIQQGDVIGQYINEIPKGAKKLKPKKINNKLMYVLAEGEVTGHIHMLRDVNNVDVYEKDGLFYVQVKNKANLEHVDKNKSFQKADHDTIECEPGIIEFGQIVIWGFKIPKFN